MDPTRFDTLARSLAAPKTRRGFLAGLGALLVGARAAGPASAQARCPAGTDPCPSGGCADKKRDRNNCGRCGNVCPAGATCVKGVCRCPRGATCGCPPGEVSCGGVCAGPDAFRFDAGNCGGCGIACGNGGDFCLTPRCDEGVCGTDAVDCEDGNPCTSNRCNGGECVTGFLSGGVCTTAGGAAGTCATGTCVETTTTTTTTTSVPASTTTTTTEQPTVTTTSAPTNTTTTTAGPCVPNCARRCGGVGDGCGGVCTACTDVFDCNIPLCADDNTCFFTPTGVAGVPCNGGTGVCDNLGNCVR